MRYQKGPFKFTLLMLIIGLLSGCTMNGAGKVFTKSDVKQKINEVCDEPYKIVSVETICENPRNVEYTCKLKERDITFQANAYLSPVSVDGSETSFFTKAFACNYTGEIAKLYLEEVRQRLADTDAYYVEKDGWFYILQYDDIPEIARTLYAADAVYAKEIPFHKTDYTVQNPIDVVHIAYAPSWEEAKAHEHWVNIADLPLTGMNTADDFQEKLQNHYAQAALDGKLTDSTIPAEAADVLHVSSLDHIQLNGLDMLYDYDRTEYSSYLLATDRYLRCWYDYDIGSYMLVSDAGYLPETSSSPLIIYQYVKTLGGEYRIDTLRSDEETCYSSWTIGDNHWEMKAKFKEKGDGFRDITVSQNGKKLPFTYYNEDDIDGINCTFLVGVTVEQFSELIDAEYIIDEKMGTVSFTTSD